MYYVVYDNFLNAEEYGIIKQYLGPGGAFPWRLGSRINAHDESNDDMYFATMIYHSYEDGWKNDIDSKPFQFISSKIHIESLFRIKANLYFPSKTKEVQHHAPHRDSNFKHQGALFFLTTCDAPTTMEDGTKIESIENRLLLFDPTSMHSSSSPTNAPYRVTINFNYFGAGINGGYKADIMQNPIPIVKYNEEILDQIFIK
jgi:hypothetical protein